jgi:peroxiredoxin
MKFTSLNIFLVAIAAGLLNTGCANFGDRTTENAGTISGHLTGLDAGSMVVLRSFKNGSLFQVAESETSENGDFSITPEPPLKKGYHQLIINKRWPVVLITDSTEAPIVTVEIPEKKGYLLGANVEGSAESELLAKYYSEIMPLQDSLLQVQTSMRTLSMEDKSVADKKLKLIIEELENSSLAFIKTHEGHPATLAALESLNPEKHSAAYKAVLQSLSKTFNNSHYYAMLKQKYDASTSARTLPNQPPPAKKSNRKNGQYAAGDEALDIVMADPDGNVRKLSDLRGKVVLLDFWASWCGPCRRENPTVVRAYEKYKSQGFEVFSVSLDSNADKWKKAIEKDGLVWPNHVCDMAGWKNAASRAYGISSIPHTMLIDRDGIIIRTHLRGPSVEAELEKLFD